MDALPFASWFDAFDPARLYEAGTGLAALIIALAAITLITHRIALPALVAFAKRSSIGWDDILVDQKVLDRLKNLPSVLAIQLGVTWVPHLPTGLTEALRLTCLCLAVVMIARSTSALLSTFNEIHRRYSVNRDRPIKGYLQVIQVLVYCVAGILIVSFILDRSPLILLSGLGAMTAVIMLVFRDSLLSLVAGIQLTQNDLIRVGDWIEMPQFNADGDVTDIALNVVTVQNWDRTITVIPTHKFLEHSFKNWRGMQLSGGRRIMRSIHLDLSTVRYLTDDEIEDLRQIRVLRPYIDQKLHDISQHNAHDLPEEFAAHPVNQRRLTNLGTLRAYIGLFLRQHKNIHQDMTLMVRQLEPDAHGVPLQIYTFTNTTVWAEYEAIQGDIFDHLLATLPRFGLRAYQRPSGHDITRGALTLASPDPSRKPAASRDPADAPL
ncbi:mechanosensitive ion channel protein MscS [Lujinxingia litoralis]|uniref:Mechanosensitive ion channel protein MscS n=1 Tax=Lujinxingia litoralis TaxID=2211119 RepID=A0A328C7Z2_9DELT|nr:mechanosensitive ion channel domain-containing protein [Lujinxingia litoralis]RAL20698.1 mechanosensitive ion channel protein MscS [Lujinxingia litoralis]